VLVWGRLAERQEESEAIRWFHGAYEEKMAGVRSKGAIYRMDLVGRVWHRMYPRVRLKPPGGVKEKPTPVPTPNYLEFLTIFPDDSLECDRSLAFLAGEPFGFRLLWRDWG
jgi:CRISPR-associated protein Cmr6